MKRVDELIGGLQALAKYGDDGSVDFSAEHDIIYAGPVGHRVDVTETEPAELAAEMDRLGWHWSSEGDCWALFT